MKKARVNPEWSAARFEEHYLFWDGEKLVDQTPYPPRRFKTAEDARLNQNTVYPFEYFTT